MDTQTLTLSAEERPAVESAITSASHLALALLNGERGKATRDEDGNVTRTAMRYAAEEPSHVRDVLRAGLFLVIATCRRLLRQGIRHGIPLATEQEKAALIQILCSVVPASDEPTRAILRRVMNRLEDLPLQ